MNKIKQFAINILLGGIVVVLPIVILTKVFLWMLRGVSEMIQPLVSLIVKTTETNVVVAEILGVVSILAVFFTIGLIVKTNVGMWFHGKLEILLLEKVPGYKILKELLSQLKPNPQRAFSKPVLITIDNHKNYFLGYITDEYDEGHYAVFVPTSPSPFNGFVIQTTAENLKFLDITSEDMMKTVIGCGVGSANIMHHIRSSPKEPHQR